MVHQVSDIERPADQEVYSTLSTIWPLDFGLHKSMAAECPAILFKTSPTTLEAAPRAGVVVDSSTPAMVGISSII